LFYEAHFLSDFQSWQPEYTNHQHSEQAWDMSEVELRDGRTVTIACWDFDNFKKHTLEKTVQQQTRCNRSIFNGFNYYGAKTIDDLAAVNTDNYSKSVALTDFEKHENLRLPNEDYHRAIVALHDETIIGLLICQWTNNRYFPFWLYHMKFVDVNQKYQNQSVATHLVKELNRSEFLNQKILYLGIFSNPGKKFLKPVCDRVLSAKNYALVTCGMYMDNPPTAPGIYRAKNNDQVLKGCCL
jgi:hypothetical protein